MVLHDFQPGQCFVIKLFTSASLVDCLDIKNRRKVALPEMPDSLYVASGLSLRILGGTEKMIGATSQASFSRRVPMLVKLPVFQCNSF